MFWHITTLIYVDPHVSHAWFARVVLSVHVFATLAGRYDFATGTKTYIRRVEYEDRGYRYFGDDRTALDTSARNNILQKAGQGGYQYCTVVSE